MNPVVLILFFVASAWVIFVVIWSVVYRRKRGLPIQRPSLDDALYLETWVSGRSHNVIWPFGYANKCLWVAVNDGCVQVSPQFPFNLGFIGSTFGLEFCLPASAVKSVEKLDAFGANVRITFQRHRGK